jgi:arylsulfatase A-like enzyme
MIGILWMGLLGASADRPTNVVLIVADDLGVCDLGCYGRTEHRTPNLDRLASEGVRFACAYAAQPICSPSRAALMTGLCPARLNLTNYIPGRPDAPSQRMLQPTMEGQLPLEEVTLAEILRDAGYATGIFGKWHLGEGRFGPEGQGFDVAVAPSANPRNVADAGGKGEFLIAEAAVAFMESHRDRPFFCYVPHNSPHIPLAADKTLVEKYGEAFQPTYAAMIETLDTSVGRVLDKIESLGLRDRTLVIFTSDNGGLHVLESLHTPATYHQPWRAGKGFLYEGGLRVPMIVRWPGVGVAGRVCETPVLLTDLPATILAAAGIDPVTTVGPLDGVDLRPLLTGSSLPDRTLTWHFPHYTNQGGRPAGAIRQGNWKLVESYEDNSVELFDLEKDSGETENLADSQADRSARMREDLDRWRRSVGARLPRVNPAFDDGLHRRLYVDMDASRLTPKGTAAETAPAWAAWRLAINAAIRGREPTIYRPEGDVRLLASEAEVHGTLLRYEREPHKRVLGYWTRVEDWASWEFETPRQGRYEVELQFGCGRGSGGSTVEVIAADQTLPFVVEETGHFQRMKMQVVGEVTVTSGRHRVEIRPRTKPGPAVMDLRRVVLRPMDLSS